MDNSDSGVFGLITELCRITERNAGKRLQHKSLVANMRTRSYALLLSTSSKHLYTNSSEPVVQLLSYYYTLYKRAQNVGEFKRAQQLKKMIEDIQRRDHGDMKESVNNTLKLLMCLADTVQTDLSHEMYNKPFTFGLLDEMLPRPPREQFGSPVPYPYYPEHIFKLPFSLKRPDPLHEQYIVETFDSNSFLPDNLKPRDMSSVKVFQSPMSISSLKSSNNRYSVCSSLDFPRLTVPRDVKIPTPESIQEVLTEQSEQSDSAPVQEVYRAPASSLWDLASRAPPPAPLDLWDRAARAPPPPRALIASSARETSLWLRTHPMTSRAPLHEQTLIRDLLYVVIGIESRHFAHDAATGGFRLAAELSLPGVSWQHLRGYAAAFLLVGTYYRRLHAFAFDAADDAHQGCGLVFQAARDALRKYLLGFRLRVTSLCDGAGGPPTLLQLLHHVEPLKYQIEIVASIYRMADGDGACQLPRGAALLSHLVTSAALVTDREARAAACRALLAAARVYCGFIDRFIFSGELDDECREFFITSDAHHVHSRTKKYWDKGFSISQSVRVPEYLRPLARSILLCGKSMRLLKMCHPADPLLQLSPAHPRVRCCTSFAQLHALRRLLRVYRTRCRFVAGEARSFAQTVLRREAARRACAELAAVKQAETLAKIVAERKRLAQLLVAERQHALRALQSAAAAAAAARAQGSRRAALRQRLEREAGRAAEEVDAVLREDESQKMMDYYSELNMEVEKNKQHTEWKIKRLQLDQTRVQLLSTEERNLKREKLELQHQRAEESMSMSTRSDNFDTKSTASDDVTVPDEEKEVESAKSTAVFSAICNVAKSFFLGSKTDEAKCDNAKELDSQGNVVEDSNSNKVQTAIESKTSSEVIGQNMSDLALTEMFAKSKEQATQNKLKVMHHELGRVDIDAVETNTEVDVENNPREPLTPFEEARRNKKKVLGDEYHLPLTVAARPPQEHTEAQREAAVNKRKVMSAEYHRPLDLATPREPATPAQEEAARNRLKVLGSDSVATCEGGGGKGNSVARGEGGKGNRSRLTLDLKACAPASAAVTPGSVTPLEFTPRLDLETPTTSEIPLDEDPGILSPPGADTGPRAADATFTSKGFDFSIIDEALEDNLDQQDTEDTPSKEAAATQAIVSPIDAAYDSKPFDPLGVKQLNGNYTADFFNSQMDADMARSCYTHPSAILEEVQKRPYADIFRSNLADEEDGDLSCDNVATLMVCLQRSVLLPLTYQLEVVNNSILTYFLVNLDMYSHLKSLKDYFFLMDGEFSRSICSHLFAKLATTANPQELLNFATLHNILDNALGSSISHVHKFSDKLSFTMTSPPPAFAHASPAALACLSLAYQVEWPLNILLSPEALARYSRVFQFLLMMRRISWVLGQAFESLKHTVHLNARASRPLLRSGQYRAAQTHRHVMACVVRALDTYIVTTCILASWKELEADLMNARTLDDLYDCHVIYIKKVLFRCLLNNRSTPVMRLLHDMFTVVLKYCRVLDAGEWTQCPRTGAFSHSSYAQLEELYHMFEKLTRYLRKVVTRLMECGYQRHLAELMSLVNLNEYYGPQYCGNVSNTGVMSP